MTYVQEQSLIVMKTTCNQREKVKKQESKTNKSKKSRNNDTDKKNNTDGYLVYENKNG